MKAANLSNTIPILQPYSALHTRSEKKEYHFKFCLVLWLLMLSGNPFVNALFGGLEPVLVVSALGLFALMLKRGKPHIDARLGVVSLIFLILLAVHSFSFQFFPWVTMAGFFCRLFIGFAIISLVDDFPIVFIEVMSALCIISFGFWALTLTGIIDVIYPNLLNLLSIEYQRHIRIPIGIYTFIIEPSGIASRENSGMFWEPGVFSGYITIALIFLSYMKNYYPRKLYKHRFIIFNIAILTTCSTTGYIILPLVWFLQFPLKNKERILGVLILLVIVEASVVYIYKNYIPFVGAKIQHQVEGAIYQDTWRWHGNRFGAMLFDLEYIKQRPLTGWGLHGMTRKSLFTYVSDDVNKGSPFTDFIVKFGLVGIFTYILFTYKAFLSLSEYYPFRALFGLGILLLSFNGEPMLNMSLGLGLMFCTRTGLAKRSALVPSPGDK